MYVSIVKDLDDYSVEVEAFWDFKDAHKDAQQRASLKASQYVEPVELEPEYKEQNGVYGRVSGTNVNYSVEQKNLN